VKEIPLFVRYQLPSKPEHVLRENVVVLQVTGRDATAPQPQSAAFRTWNRLEVRIRDGARVKTAAATLTHENTVIEFPLSDDGRNGDVASSDGLFSAIAPTPPPGAYRLRIEAEDAMGNRMVRDMEGEFEFNLPAPSPRVVR
jgi:hypothetical protein